MLDLPIEGAKWKNHSPHALQQEVCPLCYADAPIEIIDNGEENFEYMDYSYIHINLCKRCGYSCEVSYFKANLDE